MKLKANAKQPTVIELGLRAFAIAVVGGMLTASHAVAQESGSSASAQLSQPPRRTIPVSPSLFRGETWKQLVDNVLEDETKAITFPRRMKTNGQWATAVMIAAGTTALVMLDPSDTP